MPVHGQGEPSRLVAEYRLERLGRRAGPDHRRRRRMPKNVQPDLRHLGRLESGVPDLSPEVRVSEGPANLIYFNEVDKGGHFAAWEEPELFSAEVRAAFSSLR